MQELTKKRQAMKLLLYAIILTLLIPSLNAQCIEPTDSLVINKDTIFCKGVYNLPNGIIINASNIALDCDNSRITGYKAGYGILLRNKGNVAVRNCAISNFEIGIYLEHSDNNGLENNLLSNNKFGIAFYASENNSLRANIMANNTRDDTITITAPLLPEEQPTEKEIIEEVNKTITEQPETEPAEKAAEAGQGITGEPTETAETAPEEEPETSAINTAKTENAKAVYKEDIESRFPLDIADKKLKDFLEKFEETNKNLKFKKTTYYNETANITKITIEVIPLNNAVFETLSVYIDFSKCFKLLLGLIVDENPNAHIVNPDPIIMVSLPYADSAFMIDIKAEGRLSKDCRELIEIFGLADKVASKEHNLKDFIVKYKGSLITGLLEMLAIIIFFIVYTKAHKGWYLFFFALIAFIGDLLAAFNLLPAPFDWLEILLGVLILSYVLYDCHITKVFTGHESKRADKFLVAAFFIFMLNDFIAMVFPAEETAFTAGLKSFLLTPQNKLAAITAGTLMVIGLSLYITRFFPIKEPSLMANLAAAGIPLKIKLIVFYLAFFGIAHFVLNMIVQWFGVAADSIILLAAFVALTIHNLRKKQKLSIVREIEEPEEEIERFDKRFIHSFQSIKKFFLPFIAILTLAPAMDIIFYLLPSIFPVFSNVYLEILATGHTPIIYMLKNELFAGPLYKGISLAAAYLGNIIALFLFLAMPFWFWSRLFYNKSFIMQKKWVVLFFISMPFLIVFPAFRIAPIAKGILIGVDIQASSLFSVNPVSIWITLAIAFALAALAYALHKKFSRAVSTSCIVISLIFCSGTYFSYYLLGTWSNIIDSIRWLVMESGLAMAFKIIPLIYFSSFLLLTAIFYAGSFALLVWELFVKKDYMVNVRNPKS